MVEGLLVEEEIGLFGVGEEGEEGAEEEGGFDGGVEMGDGEEGFGDQGDFVRGPFVVEVLFDVEQEEDFLELGMRGEGCLGEGVEVLDEFGEVGLFVDVEDLVDQGLGGLGD